MTNFVLVPKEPTPEMLTAAAAVPPKEYFYPGHVGYRSVIPQIDAYRAMLAAAPPPPAPASLRGELDNLLGVWSGTGNPFIERCADELQALIARHYGSEGK